MMMSLSYVQTLVAIKSLIYKGFIADTPNPYKPLIINNNPDSSQHILMVVEGVITKQEAL